MMLLNSMEVVAFCRTNGLDLELKRSDWRRPRRRWLVGRRYTLPPQF